MAELMKKSAKPSRPDLTHAAETDRSVRRRREYGVAAKPSARAGWTTTCLTSSAAPLANPDTCRAMRTSARRRSARELHVQGWFVPHWPARYEGGGLGVVEQVVIREELAYAGAPLVNTNGVNMLAPVSFGSAHPNRRRAPACHRALGAHVGAGIFRTRGRFGPRGAADDRSTPTAITTSSTGRRHGRATACSPIGSSCSPAHLGGDKRQAGISFFLVDWTARASPAGPSGQ